MSFLKAHTGFYKATLILLLLVFSLSPCSVKREVLNIFDIQYIETLNKVKTTVTSASNCDTSFQNFSTASVTKANLKAKKADFSFSLNPYLKKTKEGKVLSNYSKTTTGNSPPKYILFKQLKLDLI